MKKEIVYCKLSTICGQRVYKSVQEKPQTKKKEGTKTKTHQNCFKRLSSQSSRYYWCCCCCCWALFHLSRVRVRKCFIGISAVLIHRKGKNINTPMNIGGLQNQYLYRIQLTKTFRIKNGKYLTANWRQKIVNFYLRHTLFDVCRSMSSTQFEILLIGFVRPRFSRDWFAFTISLLICFEARQKKSAPLHILISWILIVFEYP